MLLLAKLLLTINKHYSLLLYKKHTACFNSKILVHYHHISNCAIYPSSIVMSTRNFGVYLFYTFVLRTFEATKFDA